MIMSEITFDKLHAEDLEGFLAGLAELLHATVHQGASVGFILPFPMEESRAFWQQKILPEVANGARLLLIAKSEGRIAGTAQLVTDLPPNQPHRAEVAKLMVHPDFRKKGIARKLMTLIEEEAIHLGKSLLTLDTRTGDSAEPLYLDLGYEIAGVIPGYCRAPEENRLEPTTYMYKKL